MSIIYKYVLSIFPPPTPFLTGIESGELALHFQPKAGYCRLLALYSLFETSMGFCDSLKS